MDHVREAACPTLNHVLGPWRGRVAAGLRSGLRRDGPLSLGVDRGDGCRPLVAGPCAPQHPALLLAAELHPRGARTGRRRTIPDRFPGFTLGLSNRPHEEPRRAARPLGRSPRIEPGLPQRAREPRRARGGGGAPAAHHWPGAARRPSPGARILPGPEATEPSALAEDIRRRGWGGSWSALGREGAKASDAPAWEMRSATEGRKTDRLVPLGGGAECGMWARPPRTPERIPIARAGRSRRHGPRSVREVATAGRPIGATPMRPGTVLRDEGRPRSGDGLVAATRGRARPARRPCRARDSTPRRQRHGGGPSGPRSWWDPGRESRSGRSQPRSGP